MPPRLPLARVESRLRRLLHAREAPIRFTNTEILILGQKQPTISEHSKLVSMSTLPLTLLLSGCHDGSNAAAAQTGAAEVRGGALSRHAVERGRRVEPAGTIGLLHAPHRGEHRGELKQRLFQSFVHVKLRLQPLVRIPVPVSAYIYHRLLSADFERCLTGSTITQRAIDFAQCYALPFPVDIFARQRVFLSSMLDQSLFPFRTRETYGLSPYMDFSREKERPRLATAPSVLT